MAKANAKYLEDYLIKGFILIEDKKNNQCSLAYGLFCVETNKEIFSTFLYKF